MTESIHSDNIPPRPADRYGASANSASANSASANSPKGANRSGKAIAIVLAALVLAVLAAIGWTVYSSNSGPDISAVESGFTVDSDSAITLRLDVTRDDPSRLAFCIVRAREYSGAEVGRRELVIPASENGTARVETTIATTDAAVIAEVYGCGYDIPEYLKRS